MAEERVVVEFTTQGLPQTQGDIENLQNNAIGGFTELTSALELFQTALNSVQGVANTLYSSLIDSNEKLNQELLKSQVALASSLNIYKDGVAITDVTEKILASQDKLKASLKQIQKDTVELVGVTTEDVNGIFQGVLKNIGSMVGQSKEFKDPIDAATASTKGWAAALGTLGIPLEQANQEMRSLYEGDVNNPDSQIAKALAISKEQYNQWVANGELVDKLNEKLAVYVEGNRLASAAIGATATNIQGFFEDTARLVGEPLLAPVSAALQDIYKLLLDNQTLIEQLAGDNVSQLVELFNTLRESADRISESLNIDPEGFLKDGSELIGNTIDAMGELVKLGTSIGVIFGPALSASIGNAFSAISFGLEGIGRLATLLTTATDALGSLTQAAGVLGGLDIGKVFRDAQTDVAKLNGDYQDSIDAITTYRDTTDTLIAQAERMVASGAASSAMVKGQIESLEEQKAGLEDLKLYREQDVAAQEASIAAIDKSIAALEDLKGATDDITFSAPALADLGSMMDNLGKSAADAIATMQRDGGGKIEVFSKAAESLVDLTQKQVEYGQITAEQGMAQLEAVVDNQKLELEVRESALEAMKGLAKDFTDFKVDQLDRELEAVERRVKTGSMSEIEGANASAEISKQQLQLQIDNIDQQIDKAEDLGLSTEKLSAEKEKLISQGLDAELEAAAKIQDIREKELEDSYKKTLDAANMAESARMLALEKSLANQEISQEEFDQKSVEATKERLAEELKAEEENQRALETLLASSTTAEQRAEIEGKISDSKQKSIELERQALKETVALAEQATNAAKKAIEERLKQAEEYYKRVNNIADEAAAAESLKLKQDLANKRTTQEQYDRGVLASRKERLEAEIKAEDEKVAKLSAIEMTDENRSELEDKITAAKQRSMKASEELLDMEIEASARIAEGLKTELAERLKVMGVEYSEREARLRATVKNESELQTKLAQLTITRIREQLKAETELAEKLEKAGDAKGAAETKLNLRKLAVDLIDAEIKAEEALQNAIKAELNLLREKLELRKGAAEVDLLKDELALAEAVKNGVATKEEAEKAKLEIARRRILAELELLQGLEGKGDESDKQKNTQDILKAKIQLANLDKQITDSGQKQNETSKEQAKSENSRMTIVSSIEAIQARSAAKQLSALEAQKATMAQILSLMEIEVASVARVGELRNAQAGLLGSQLAAIDSGLSNELSVVNAAISARTKLAGIEAQMNSNTDMSYEQRAALEKEAIALRAQLGALGEEGNKTELELMQQKQQAEQNQLQVKREQLALSREMAALELENQARLIELDKVRADFKVRELEIEAKKLQLQAQQADSQASASKDEEQAANLRSQAEALRQQAANAGELATTQKQAAEDEALIRQKMLETQAKSGEVQAAAQEDSLNTQQKLLNSQQAYEASLKGLKPNIDMTSVDEFAAKIRNIRAEVAKISSISLPNLKLAPGNLNVSVKDDRSVAPLNAISRASKQQADYLASVKTSVAPLGGKMDAMTRAVKALQTGGGQDTTVKNQITVNVSGKGNEPPTVSVQSALDQRKKECGCK